MNNISAYVLAVMQLAPLLIQMGEDLVPLVTKVISVVKSGGDPSDADWTFIHDAQDRLTAIIDEPEDE